MNDQITATYQEVIKARQWLHHVGLNHWKQENVFTWQWWLLVALTIFPLIFWWKHLDKKRAYEIGFFGCMINIFAVILDDIGTDMVWWGYPIKLEPFVPPLLTADSILVPIVLMIAYQHFSYSWKAFLIAILIAGIFIAFVAEPIFIWIGYYQLFKWKLVYSFLFYIFAPLISRLIIIKISK